MGHATKRKARLVFEPGLSLWSCRELNPRITLITSIFHLCVNMVRHGETWACMGHLLTYVNGSAGTFGPYPRRPTTHAPIGSWQPLQQSRAAHIHCNLAVGTATYVVGRVMRDVVRLTALTCPFAVRKLASSVCWNTVQGVDGDFLSADLDGAVDALGESLKLIGFPEILKSDCGRQTGRPIVATQRWDTRPPETPVVTSRPCYAVV